MLQTVVTQSTECGCVLDSFPEVVLSSVFLSVGKVLDAGEQAQGYWQKICLLSPWFVNCFAAGMK